MAKKIIHPPVPAPAEKAKGHYVVEFQKFLDDNGLNPNKVARLSGMSVVALYKLRDGKTKPNLETLEILRNGVGMTLDYVVWVAE